MRRRREKGEREGGREGGKMRERGSKRERKGGEREFWGRGCWQSVAKLNDSQLAWLWTANADIWSRFQAQDDGDMCTWRWIMDERSSAERAKKARRQERPNRTVTSVRRELSGRDETTERRRWEDIQGLLLLLFSMTAHTSR